MVKRASTYRAVQAVSPGKLELVQKPLTDPPPGYLTPSPDQPYGVHATHPSISGTRCPDSRQVSGA